jgi:hypothetical protein
VVNGSELARLLGVTKGRVSQLASQGKLEGCYTGDRRDRRYDPDKVAQALRVRLDPGQRLGNGARTQVAISDILARGLESSAVPPVAPPRDGALNEGDQDSYELHRKAKLTEEVRRLRRQNALEEGTLILASEVERHVTKLLRQELAQIEDMLRTAARSVADRLGVDFRQTRQILIDTWRTQRHGRAEVLAEQADGADLSEEEMAADI